MNLKVLNEISQSPIWFHFHEGPKVVSFTGSKMMVSKAPEKDCCWRRGLGVHVQGTEFQFGEMKTLLEMDGQESCTTMYVYLTPLNCTGKKFRVMLILPQLKKQKLKTERIIWKYFNYWNYKWRKGVLLFLVTHCCIYLRPLDSSLENSYLHTVSIRNWNSKSLTHLPPNVCTHINMCILHRDRESVCTIYAMLLKINGCILSSWI